MADQKPTTASLPAGPCGSPLCREHCQWQATGGEGLCGVAQRAARAPLTRAQKAALRLLARGGARYGTRHSAMAELRNLGLAYAHDKGTPGPGRWTWRPTAAGRAAISVMEAR